MRNIKLTITRFTWQSSGRPGDLDYIDQYADDIANVISTIRKNKPGGKIILAGHSISGGIALRYAMKQNMPNVEGPRRIAYHVMVAGSSCTMGKPLCKKFSAAFSLPGFASSRTSSLMNGICYRYPEFLWVRCTHNKMQLQKVAG